MKTEHVGFKCSKRMARAIERLARIDRRHKSDALRIVIEDFLVERGLLERPAAGDESGVSPGPGGD